MAMRVPCTILRGFPFSADGFTPEHAEAGSIVGIPGGLVDGLARAGYLRRADEVKAMGQAVENKMIEAAPENKHPLDHDGDGRPGGSLKPEQTDDLPAIRAAYQAKFGKRPFMGWDRDELTKRMNGDG